jgi:hypothetical protein
MILRHLKLLPEGFTNSYLNFMFNFKPNEKLMQKYIDKINLDKYEPIATKIGNSMEDKE